MAATKRSSKARRAGASGNPAKTSARKLTYAGAGVDIHEGDRFVDMIQSMMRRTHSSRVIENPGGFAGMFRLDWNEKLFQRNFKNPVLVACTDGVGTKVKVAAEVGRYDTIGIDLVAMNVNDLIVQGAEPLFFLDYIATNKVVPERLVDIVKGITDGCRQAGCALLGGETAEMPAVYAPGEFDLAGFAVGVVELKRAMDPERVEPGDIVLGLASSGVHSNGYALVRSVVEHAGLEHGAVYKELDPERTLGEVLLTPTRIYVQPIVKLQRAYTVKKVITGMAHITGSGLAANLERALHEGVDAELDESAWEPPAVFPFLEAHGNIDSDEMRAVFNMGLGYCLVVRPVFASAIRQRLRRMGERVSVVGKIVKGSGKVRIARRERR